MIRNSVYVKLTYNSDTYFIFGIILTNLDERYLEYDDVFIISELTKKY